MNLATKATTKIGNFASFGTADYSPSRQFAFCEWQFTEKGVPSVVPFGFTPGAIYGRVDNVIFTNKANTPRFVQAFFWVVEDQFTVEFSPDERVEIRRRYEEAQGETLKLSELRKLRYFIEPEDG